MVEITGGAKLERALAEIASQLGNGGTLRVGFLENARYPGGMPVAAIAAFQDFGTPNARFPIPPRPFFRNMVKAKSPEWGAAIAGLCRQYRYNVASVLGITGAAIQGQLKQSIIETNDPPLAPSTIRAKGFSKPLIDTSHMINSVDYEVTVS